MDIKKISTAGITYLEQLEGSAEWYWGSDYVHGDLYEAEELFGMGHKIDQNDLVLVHWPDGELYRPLPKQKGRYFGRPVFCEGRIALLLADFAGEKIELLSFLPEEGVRSIAEIPLSEVPDCYNLMPHGDPLMITRSAKERFQIVWPEKLDIEIGPTETFYLRMGDELYFDRWTEDPDYREETVVRDMKGDILRVEEGTLRRMPDGSVWRIG